MGYIDNLSADLSEEEVQARHVLEAKRLKAIEYLGERWVLHPKHNPKNNGSMGSIITKHQITRERIAA